MKTSFKSLLAAGHLSIAALAMAVFALSIPLGAQVENGINGSITDSTGALVVQAGVTVTNAATGVTSAATTSTAGTYTIVGLIPGDYSVKAVATGFKLAEAKVTVEVAKMSTVNFTLSPGAATQTVEIRENSIALDTTSPVIGTTVEPELIETAPLEINSLARQIDSFIYLAPGVEGSSSSHTIDGGVTYENEVQFNGVPVAFVQFEGNQTYINPPYEAVQEFRVDGSTFDPQFGLGQGAVTFDMASGGNAFHGDAFDILRNQLFDSDGFFPTRFSPSGKPEPPVDQQNDYGFTVGGPVWLPKLYNGRNRTFFYFSGDWFRQNLAQSSVGTVPTAAERSGDFSGFVDATGKQIPIYDPTTGQPFPQNKIPAGRISKVSQSLLQYIPDPDRAGVNFGQDSNKSPAVPSVPISQDLWDYTVDHDITSTQNIHFTHWRDLVSSPNFTYAPIVPSSNPLQSEMTNNNLGTGLLLNYVKTFNPNLVLTAGGDWIGNVIGQHNANSNVSFPAVSGSTTLPLIQFDGQNALTSWGVSGNAFLQCCEGGLTVINNRMLGIVGVSNLLWIKGRHTLNFGFQVRRTYQDTIDCDFCSGTFNFSQKTTSTPDSSNTNFGSYGSSFASFLLGDVDSTERIFANNVKLRNKAFAPYVQDQFKLSKRLTVNLGLRWDVLVPFTEVHNDIIFANRTEPNPGAGGIPGAATKFGNCTGCAGITRADIQWKNYQPRLGFSYQLDSKTVIQSGFYISFLNGGAYEYGTSFAASFMSSLLDGSFLRSSTGSDIPGYGSWDSQALPYPQQVPFGPSIANDGTIFDFPYKTRNHMPELPNAPAVGTAPYDSAWNARIQRELPWDMFLSVAYVGNRAIHLPTTLELSNQPNPSVLQYGALLGKNILDPTVVAAGFKAPYPEFTQQFGASATLEQALSPFPQFGGFFPVYEVDGTAFYNALQAQAEKRYVGGVSYLANFTLGSTVANTFVGSGPFSPNGMNAYNPAPEYVRSPNVDQLYNFKLVGTYALPFGHGKKYLNSSNTLVSELAGGWQVSGILNYAGGNPFGAQNNYNPLEVNGFDRPNIVSGVSLKTYDYGRSKAFFTGRTSVQPVQFTTNAFQNTGPWGLGSSKRAYPALRTPPLRIESFDAIKSFKIWERLQASVRVDYFNAFNRTQLQAPDNNSLDSTFGQIINTTSQISNRQGQATFRVEF
ncbi:MAG: carboxypeptidase regulatory-like domain-containing protein [Terracidiphilus sp.]